MLEFRDVTKRFGSTEAVRQVRLQIRPGEFFSLLGPSGCGKTTLLRMLGGFEQPTEGGIYLDDRRLDEFPAHKRPVNMVFQKYALFPHLSVSRNVAFGLEMKNVPAPEIATRVKEALDLVQMGAFADRSIQTLSGGQQQRIALARALVNRPQILLLDEPLSALDLKLRQQMQIELLMLQRRLKTTFIFVTHDQEEALTLSDRIAVMNAGQVEQVGTPQEIYEFPRTIFVARFIGSVNSWESEINTVSSERIEVSGPWNKSLSVRAPRDGSRRLPFAPSGTKVHTLVRPEKIKLLKTQPTGDDQNWLEGTLKEVIYQGPTTLNFIQSKDSPDAAPIQVNVPNTAVTARKAFQLGDRVFLSWAPEDSLLVGQNQALYSDETLT